MSSVALISDSFDCQKTVWEARSDVSIRIGAVLYKIESIRKGLIFMKYGQILPAIFQSRPNRFIAHVSIGNETQICHVKNTGRCRELLIPGCQVFVEVSQNPARKTAYDLIAVRKGERLINMDSQAPNKVFREWVEAGGLFPGFTTLRPECVHGDSRFDFYVEAPKVRGFVEVKGVTLEEDGVVRFPDAPTERGVKHLEGLSACVREGFDAWIVFIVQMRGVRYLTPNNATHPAFGEALRAARDQGVRLLALDCDVTEDSITARDPVELRL